jgi:hypothetical protein
MDDTDIATTVDGLLAASGIRPTPKERARLIATYPSHRQAIDSLYAIDEVRYEAPGTISDAAPDFTDWSS